ncbi:UBC-like protein [Teratosphaeria nubilosa]|uniref:E2 ubiquitin-conjugating enzyme n=1 Tax=Teratosphaeria nubilosa TaxID=161662 RepID=A0A6G1KXN4_9PEZI|nr:UBC-like protein [Teratosphaeria nubilosa]
MSGNKRVMKELAEIQSNPPTGTTVKLLDEADVNLWECTMEGPAGSIYAGGHFKIHVTLPKEYPFKPPVIAFKTKIYHPNVSNDDKGSMCMGMLRPEAWKPPNKIREVLMLVRAVLEEPQPDDAVEVGIADEYKSRKAQFEKTAKDWVGKYAK